MDKPLWDTQRHDEYVKKRDEAIARQADQREGTSVARDLDATWALLAAEERRLLEYLVLSGARSCVGHCADPLLSRFVERGMLNWPPGIRPVLTDDLVTVFSVAPALWAALNGRCGDFFAPERDKARTIAEAAKEFSGRVTPIASGAVADADSPVA